MDANKQEHAIGRKCVFKVGQKTKADSAQSYLVLSGGLGGSSYVKTQLEQKYSSTNITIIRSQEPRLSVVKGLVMDRKQRLVSGAAALKTRM
jgi:hypothetical protein